MCFVVGKVEHDDAEVDTVDGLFRVEAWDAHEDHTRNICDGRNTDDVKERALRPTASGKQTKSYIASEGWKREATNDRPINLGVGINRERREVGGLRTKLLLPLWEKEGARSRSEWEG
nr:hypothetical protein [uncultured Sphingomonas sp.]